MAQCINHPERTLDYEEACPLCLNMFDDTAFDPHGTARDAARYRAIRKHFVLAVSYGGWFLNSYILKGVTFEAALDAAIAREVREEACVSQATQP